MQFELKKKGYDPQAVDQYISVKNEEHRDQLNTLKQRNALLTDEVAELRRANEALRGNEARITKLLSDAEALVEQVRQTVDAYREEEMDRLSSFRDKWTTYAADYLHDNLQDFAAKLDEYAFDYAKTLQRDLNENLFLMADPLWRDYQSEKARTEPFSAQPIHIEELLEKLKAKP